MRTAVTVAKKHDGSWVMLGHPGVSLVEQLKSYRALLGAKGHADYAYVQIQESDGHERHVYFSTVDKAKESEARRAAEQKAAELAGKAAAQKPLEALKKLADERGAAKAAEIDRLNQLPQPPKKQAEAKQPFVTNRTSVTPSVDAEGLRLDGPSPEEWKAAGYTEDTYPPKGFAAKPKAADVIIEQPKEQTA